MAELQSIILSIGIIVVIVFFIMPEGALVQLINWISGRPKQIKMKPQDLFQRFFKQRVRIGKAQRDWSIKKLLCSGDLETHAVFFRRIKGNILDGRCAEFFIRLHFWQITPAWFLIPTEFIESLLTPIIVVHCRGFRNMGGYYIPLLRTEDLDKEEAMKKTVHSYVKNLMKHEQLELLAEQEINNLSKAIAPEPAPVYITRSYDMPITGAEEADAE